MFRIASLSCFFSPSIRVVKTVLTNSAFRPETARTNDRMQRLRIGIDAVAQLAVAVTRLMTLEECHALRPPRKRLISSESAS